MRTSILLLLGASSIVLMGCGEDPPLGTSKERCPTLDRGNLEGEVVADSCFQLGRDAFGFKNYPDGANLRVKEMIDVFGEGVCRSDGAKCSPSMEVHGHCNASCVLTDEAMKHMKRYNQWMDEGHCDGMAALSQRWYSAANGTPTIERPFDETLQHDIARWWATQITVQQRGAGVYEDKEPAEVGAYLNQLWTNHSNATLWVYYVKGGHTAAHALTPYAITSPKDGEQRMYVYDSNEPTAVRYVELHLGRGEWRYDLDPGATQMVVAGSGLSPAGLDTLRFVSNEARIGRYCWFCEETFANTEQNLLTLGRDAPARVFNKTEELAKKSEQGVWSVANDVELHFPLANLEDHPLPSIIFTPTEAYQIEFTGSIDNERGEFLVSMPGDTTFGVVGIQAPPGKTGMIGTATVEPQIDKPKIHYASIDAANVTLQWSTERRAADQTMTDVEFRVTMKGPAAGVVSLQDDETTGEMTIGFEAKDPNFNAYELKFDIARIGASGFVETDEFIRPADAQQVTYHLKTNAMSSSVWVDIDINSDGSVEMQETWTPLLLDLTQGTYTLKTEFLGENVCLEGNDPNSPEHAGNAFLNGCIPASGQVWQFIPIMGTPYYQLQMQFFGATKCLEGDPQAQLMHGGAAFMNDCNASAPGQNWSILKGALGNYILQAPLVNPQWCLEGNEPDSPIHTGAAFLDECQDVSGQQWYFIKQP